MMKNKRKENALALFGKHLNCVGWNENQLLMLTKMLLSDNDM